jgi:hypothetical protein
MTLLFGVLIHYNMLLIIDNIKLLLNQPDIDANYENHGETTTSKALNFSHKEICRFATGMNVEYIRKDAKNLLCYTKGDM